MKRIGAIVTSLVVLVAAGDARATPPIAPDSISAPFVALRGADRVGNAMPADQHNAPPTTAPPTTAPPTTAPPTTAPPTTAPPTTAPPTTAPPTTTAPSVPGVSPEAQEVLELVNVERTARGLVALRLSTQLNEAALDHSIAQAADGDIYHVDPDDGSSPGDRIARTGYRVSTWGENVAAGYPTVASVMRGWMLSPGHCRNILNPAFTELGVGYVEGGVRYGEFWTQVFARPQGEPRPPGVYDPDWC